MHAKLWTPSATPHARIGALLTHTFIAAAFMLLAFNWPGTAVLALLYLFAGYMSGYAGILLDSAFHDESDGVWLRVIGGSLAAGGVLVLCLGGDPVAIAPLAIGAWLTARARGFWPALAGVLLFMAGLLLVSEAGSARVSNLAVFGMHVLSTGVMVLAFAPRSKRPAASLALAPSGR